MENGSREEGMEKIRVQRIDLMLYCCAKMQKARGQPLAASTAVHAGRCVLDGEHACAQDLPPDF